MATLSNFTIVPPDAQQSVWLTGDRATFVATSEDTNGQFSLFNFFLPPQVGTTPHTHLHEDEAAYILDGNVSFQLNDQTFTVSPGGFVYAPEGETTISFRNLEITPAKMAVITTPAGLEDFFGAVGLPTTGTVPPSPPPLTPELFDTILEIATEHEIEVPDTLSFTAPEYSITEDGTPIASVTVLRPGKAEGAVGATITLSDSTAESSEDYSPTQIPVNFAAEERFQTVTIPIIDDDLVEGNETINLALTNPTGGASLSLLQDKSFLTVEDNDDLSLGGGSNNSLEELYNLPNLPVPERQEFLLGGNSFTSIATGDDTNGGYSLFDVSISQQIGSESYIHGQADEAFYILDGDVSFLQGDQAITASAGTFIYAPKGDLYGISSVGTTPARALLLSPGGVFSPTSVPEPSLTWSLLALVTWGVNSLKKNKLQK